MKAETKSLTFENIKKEAYYLNPEQTILKHYK